MDLIDQTLLLYLPAAIRIFGVLLFLPFGGNPVQNLFLRVSIAACLSLLFPVECASDELTIGRMLGELFVGIVLSLPLVLTISAASMCGDVFDTARGQNIAGLYDPQSGGSTSSCALLLKYYTINCLFTLGFFSTALEVLSKSFILIPQAGFTAFASKAYPILIYIAQTLQDFFFIIAPLAALFLLVDLIVLYLGKLLPQGNFFAESMLIKTALGFLMLQIIFGSGQGGFIDLVKQSTLNLMY